MERTQSIGQRLMIGINGTRLDDETREHLRTIRPGSVILFSRNIENLRQIKALIDEIKTVVDPKPLIAIDQEGGLVVRFFEDMTIMPGNMALGALKATGSTDRAFRQGVLTARELKSIGIDINLAPVIDVVTGYDNPGITVRSFGADSERVAALGKSLILGMQSGGVAAVAKHFPGKGSAGKDAHYDLPRVEDSWSDLKKRHLHPFQDCVDAGVRGVMSTHVLYSHFAAGEDVPATFSQEMIRGYLRETMGFEGVVFSDDMEMGAIAKFFPFEEAVLRTARAGHDMILVCSDYGKQRCAFETLLEADQRADLSAADMAASLQRISDLRQWCSSQTQAVGEAPFAETRLLAETIARESITVVPGGVSVPLTDVSRIHALIPDLATIASREKGLEGGEDNFIKRSLEAAFPGQVDCTFIAIDATKKDIDEAVHTAAAADLVVAFVFNARYEAGQRALVERLKMFPVPTVFVLIRNPFDIELIGPEHTSVITYGYRKVQLAAALDVLAGKIEAKGRAPFEVRYGA